LASHEDVTCVVQARMGSSRLPGKVLEDLGGQPLLGFLLDRISALDVRAVVVATSDRPDDDAIVKLCEQKIVPVVRGPEDDVLARFVVALDAYPSDHIIRLTADCPLTDPVVVADVLSRHLASGADYTSNTLPRTYPQGLDVEVVRSEVLRAAAAEATDDAEREHVMPFVYRRPERFRLANLRSGHDLGAERWTVDTPEDLERLRAMVRVLQEHGTQFRPDRGPDWLEVVSVVGRTPVERDRVRIRPAVSSDAPALLRWRNAEDAVEFSLSGRPVGKEEHSRWLDAILDDPGRQLFIGEWNGAAVGMVRVDVRAGRGVVSISVDPEQRRAGHAGEILGRLTDFAAGWMQVDQLDAVVHLDNTASRRLFERAGFVPIEIGQEFVTLAWTSPRLRRREEVAHS
jgi:spore coat polysaccharide biosynthesis protein SpsF